MNEGSCTCIATLTLTKSVRKVTESHIFPTISVCKLSNRRDKVHLTTKFVYHTPALFTQKNIKFASGRGSWRRWRLRPTAAPPWPTHRREFSLRPRSLAYLPCSHIEIYTCLRVAASNNAVAFYLLVWQLRPVPG